MNEMAKALLQLMAEDARGSILAFSNRSGKVARIVAGGAVACRVLPGKWVAVRTDEAAFCVEYES